MYPAPRREDMQLVGFIVTDIDEEAEIVYGVAMFDRLTTDKQRYVVWRCGLQYNETNIWDYWSGFYTISWDSARNDFAYRGNLHAVKEQYGI